MKSYWPIIIEYVLLFIWVIIYYIYKRYKKRIRYVIQDDYLLVYNNGIYCCKRKIKTSAGTYYPDISGKDMKQIAEDTYNRNRNT